MAATSLPGGNLPAHRSLEERGGRSIYWVVRYIILHDYGEWVRLEDVETGKVLIEVRGELDEEGKTHGVERKIIGFGENALSDFPMLDRAADIFHLDFNNLPPGELHVDGAIGRHANN